VSETENLNKIIAGISIFFVVTVSVIFLLNDSNAAWRTISHVTEFEEPVMLSEIPERGLEILAYAPAAPQAIYLYYQYPGFSSEPLTMNEAGSGWYRGYIKAPEFGGDVSYYIQAAYLNRYFAYPEDGVQALSVFIEDDISFEERHPYLFLSQEEIEEKLPRDPQRGDALRQVKVEFEVYLTPSQYKTVNQAIIATEALSKSGAVIDMAKWYIDNLDEADHPASLSQPSVPIPGTAKRHGYVRHRYYFSEDDERLFQYALALTGKEHLNTALVDIAYKYSYEKDVLSF